jgi:hypothetical protein
MECRRGEFPATRLVAAGIPVSFDVFVAPVCRVLTGAEAVVSMKVMVEAYSVYLHTFAIAVAAPVVEESEKVVEEELVVAEKLDTDVSVSVRSSASSGRARRRAKRRALRAKQRAEQKSDVTYTPAVEVSASDGFCYLRMVSPQDIAVVQQDLGSSPDFSRVLGLPASVLSTDWKQLMVSGNKGVYHVATTGMVGLPMCLTTVASQGQWAFGTVGQLVMSMGLTPSDILVEKSPLLSDLLAGDSGGCVKPLAQTDLSGRVDVVTAEMAAKFLQSSVEQLMKADVSVVSLGCPFEARYLQADGVSAAVVFQGDKSVGMVPLQSLESNHVEQVCSDLLVTDSGPGLVCYGIDHSMFTKEQLVDLPVRAVSYDMLWKTVEAQRTGIQAYANLRRVTREAERTWGKKMKPPRSIYMSGDDSMLGDLVPANVPSVVELSRELCSFSLLR